MIDLALLSQFHFIRPWWLLALIPIAILVILRFRQENRPDWITILPKHLRKVLTIGEQGWKKMLPLKVLAVSMILAAIIAAGPTWQREASPFGEDKAALVMVLDVSQSMLEADVSPSRLERAKHKIRDLLELRGGGRNALVVFAGSAHLMMPLTQDNSVLIPFLEAVDPTVMPEQGKNAINALPLVDALLESEQGGSVLFITDQVTASVSEALQAEWKSREPQLLVLGVGNSDVASINPADLDSLKLLASSVGGRFLPLSVDESDVTTLNRYIERNMALNGDSAMPWKDMGYYAVYPLALLLLLWFRRGWLVQWMWIVVVVPLATVSPTSFSQAVESISAQAVVIEQRSYWDKAKQWWLDIWLTADQQGQWLFNQKAYLDAAAAFDDPLRKGIAFYYGSDYARAYSEFVQLDTPLGVIYAANALARQRQYVKARGRLTTLLKQQNLPDATRQIAEHNLAVINAIVEEVNRMSESQIGTPDGPEQSTELADDQPQTGDGVDEQTTSDFVTEQTLNADDILGDAAVADKWLKGVEADPKRFLRAKFQIQYNEKEAQ
ncbi:VWA domain-containing protein [Vibrio astriarenae]